MGKTQRLIIVSNRLPFTVTEENGEVKFGPSSGGLVTGLHAYLEQMSRDGDRRHIWVGWPGGTIDAALQKDVKTRALREFSALPVFLTEREMDDFYLGFCNKTIWPLFHYFPSYTEYVDENWEQYWQVNDRFCNALLEIVDDEDTIWVHDYHLMLLPRMLKARRQRLRIGFFLHIPFPSFEVFRLLPNRWRRDILEGLLGADLVGFHTYDYMQHFLQSVLRILGHEHHMGQIVLPQQIVKVGSFPMGVDYRKFALAATEPDTERERTSLRESLPGSRVILSIDRLDYSKGILNRLEGFSLLLETCPEYLGKVVLLMVVVPSRIGVLHYEQMKKQIEEMVGRINGKFGTVAWVPVIYQFRAVPFQSLVALYGISDIALVTPLRDGMNLIAKEYVSSRPDRTGVLILSEMAGAAKELGESVSINPNDRREIAAALREGLEMPAEEQIRRNAIMQQRLQRYDVVRWATDFVQQLTAMRDVQERFYAKLLPDHMRQLIVDRYKSATRRLLLLDYDGTLVPLMPRPHLARPTENVLTILRALADDPANAVVMISGRDRGTMTRWFGDIPIDLVAEHGVWYRHAQSEWQMLKSFSDEWKGRILPILEMYADRLPGSFVEQKDHSLVWHYRAADPDQAPQIASELMDHLVSFTANIELQVLRGNKVVEVRNAGVHKGTAAMYWIARHQESFILAAGDDWTDEDMFGMLPSSAVSLRVGITSTHALYNVRDSADVIRLLQQFHAATHTAVIGVREAQSTPPR